MLNNAYDLYSSPAIALKLQNYKTPQLETQHPVQYDDGEKRTTVMMTRLACLCVDSRGAAQCTGRRNPSL